MLFVNANREYPHFPGRVSFQGETAGKETENMNTEEKKIAVIGIGGEGVSSCDDGCTWRQGREHPEKRPGASQ